MLDLLLFLSPRCPKKCFEYGDKQKITLFYLFIKNKYEVMAGDSLSLPE